MLGNNSVYAQIQRRRRRSTPNSPASPSATWQNTNTTDDFLQAAPRDEKSHHALTGPGSPALDADVPSPTFNLPSFSAAGRQTDARSESFGRPQFTEEHGQQLSRSELEKRRLAKCPSYNPRLHIPQIAKPGVFSSYPLDQSFAPPGPPSSHGPELPSPEGGARHSDRGTFTNLNHSHASLANSSLGDEMPALKFTAGKKSRLNLLNLLARRRSSQNQNSPEDVSLHVKTSFFPGIPDDYDPRIRGSIIHDFSTPRPRKLQLSLDSPTQQTTSLSLGSGPFEHVRRASDFSGLKDATSKRHSQSPNYSPVFKEHFQDDRQNLRPAQTGYLHSFAMSEQISGLKVPAFAKKLPAVINEGSDVSTSAPSRPPPPLPKDHESLETLPEAVSDLSKLPDKPSVPPAISKAPTRQTLSSTSIQRRISGSPKHMTSTSSRFSFIKNGDSAVQEKILEERHKQHASNRKTIVPDGDEGQDQEDYDEYDLDVDDTLEERIPGVNADDEFEEEIPGMSPNAVDKEENRRISIPLYQAASKKRASLKIDPNAANDYARTDSRQAFHFTPEPSGLSSNSTGATSQPTPRDEDGRIIGLADTSYSPRRVATHQRQRSDLSIAEVSGGLPGLELTTVQPVTESQLTIPTHGPAAQHDAFRDEDLYFDDGEFDDLVDDVNEEEIDERIFDEGSEAVRDIPAENARKLEEARHCSSIGKTAPVGHNQNLNLLSFQAHNPELVRPSPATVAANGIDAASNAGLTEDNLAAYHAALVSAADTAAANGRFARSVSNSYYSDTSTSQLEDSPPGLSDDKRNSHNVEFSGIDEYDGFDDDDDDEDDLIAEANAEVLENDDDGFYGQEFGFYARAKGKNAAELEYGGYFVPRGSNGIKRSHSAKANFQEPSLTPITERSEWSARNSVASLHIPGMPTSAQSIPSPGIAQLLDFESSSFDENISFEALMKLRRGTFGGSSTSINSLGGPPSGSPLAHVSAHSFAGGDASHRMTSSIHSLTGSAGIPESEEEEDNIWDELRLTRNKGTKDTDAIELRTPESTATFSPISARSDKRMGHSRNSSGAESVSYVRDTDGRWLLERRRTSEDGEGEIIGREYLAGSRI
jgi:hypothetical protein